MADQRKGQRSKATKVQPTARSGTYKTPRGRTEASLKQECEKLRAELEAARAEIAELRARHADVINRIDWVLESLDGLEDASA